MSHLYDRIGQGYTAVRREDPTIAAAVHAALGDARTVVNVGAGAGSYEPRDRDVIAVEPSPVMLAQRPVGAAPAVQASAEALPFADGSFDFLSIGFAMRHLPDLRRTFGEFRRVLRPGGVAVVLEIAPPRSRVGRGLLRLYLGKLVPALTRWGTRSAKATELMRYYWDTVEQCVPPEAVLGALRDAGFTRVERHVELAVFNEYRAIV